MAIDLSWAPAPLHSIIEAAIAATQADPRVVGLTLGGSAITGRMDEYSDLDFVVITRNEDLPDILGEARSFAAKLGPLLSAFTGEHVRDPRLLLCLYEPPLLRVDLKFVADRDLDHRVENGRILWQRDSAIDAAFQRAPAIWPRVDPQWIEDRFWLWLHNGVTKAGRGELFACLEQLAFLRRTVLGPLIAQHRGHQPDGVRRIELIAPDLAPAMAETIGNNSAIGYVRALRATVDLYRQLREVTPEIVRNPAESAITAYLAVIEKRLEGSH